MKFLFLLPLFLNKLCEIFIINDIYRSSHPEVFLEKVVLKICSKFTGEHPCRSVISIKLLCNFVEITVRHECSPVNLLYIFRTPFLQNTSGWLLLHLFPFPFYQKLQVFFKKNHRCLKEVIAQLLYIMIFIIMNLKFK